MPPGTEAPAPPPTNPTTSNVRPGTITNKGQPYWVRSTPRTTTPRAKMPTTTRTTPRAALEPPPRGRTGGEGEVVKGGGAAVITAVGEAGSAGSAGSAFSTGTSAAGGGASGPRSVPAGGGASPLARSSSLGPPLWGTMVGPAAAP